MKAVRIDVDGVVDLIDFRDLDDLRKAIGGGWAEFVHLGDIARITTKAEHPQHILHMVVDDDGIRSGLQVNLLAMGVLRVIGGRLTQNLHGPAVFIESDPDTGDTVTMQKVVSTLLRGIAHRMTVDNLDILAEANQARSRGTVIHLTGRQGLDILDTTNTDDITTLGWIPAPDGPWNLQAADRLLGAEGWERSDNWQDAAWLYEGEDADGQLFAPIRKR